jgi:hypothetical protein
LDALLNVAVEFVGQTDIPGGHGRAPYILMLLRHGKACHCK